MDDDYGYTGQSKRGGGNKFDNTQNMILMHPPQIKNKAPNPIQITAEQLLKDAEIHRQETIIKPDERIRDNDELEEHKLKKRKEFEDKVRRQRFYLGTWIKYGVWEESLQEFRRARSVFERALEVDYKNHSLWMKYAEMEMRHKFVNHARNVFERAIDVLPRVDQFWYKYSFMEEVLGNYIRAREIFQAWMKWRPCEKAWLAYIAFENRMNEPEKACEVMLAFMQAHPKLPVYLRAANFAIKQKKRDLARQIFERILEELGQAAIQEEYFIQFAKFELKNKEIDRAREIFRFGLANIPKEKSIKLYTEYLTFEKQFGQKEEIDELVLNQRREHYKQLLSQSKLNYDAWFDLIHLEIAWKDFQKIRETFEQAISNVPPVAEKRYWRRYIYLWYAYAMFEELDANDSSKAEKIYERCLALVPHSKFTFSKLWIQYAHFKLRCTNLQGARQLFGQAIGRCPNEKIFDEYIEMEQQLAEIDRVRKLYERYIEIFPENPKPWIKWGEWEKSIDELERYRAIFDLAINNTIISMPETVWKAYIDNEVSLNEYGLARNLYERLLQITKHYKVWVSYAQFEAEINERFNCREILTRAEEFFKANPEMKEERANLIEVWMKIEQENFKDEEAIEQIRKKKPIKIKKQRKVTVGDFVSEDKSQQVTEEYYDYIFPEQNKTNKNIKILEKARLWKDKLKVQQQEELRRLQQELDESKKEQLELENKHFIEKENKSDSTRNSIRQSQIDEHDNDDEKDQEDVEQQELEEDNDDEDNSNNEQDIQQQEKENQNEKIQIQSQKENEEDD